MTWTVVSIHTMISERGVVPSISLHNTTDQGGRGVKLQNEIRWRSQVTWTVVTHGQGEGYGGGMPIG